MPLKWPSAPAVPSVLVSIIFKINYYSIFYFSKAIGHLSKGERILKIGCNNYRNYL